GMVHGQEAHAVKIDNFLHRFHEPEAELAVFLLNYVAIDFDVLGGARDIALPRPNPVSDHACTEHIGHKFIMRAIPNEQRGARATATIDFCVGLLTVSWDLDFILQNTSL